MSPPLVRTHETLGGHPCDEAGFDAPPSSERAARHTDRAKSRTGNTVGPT